MSENVHHLYNRAPHLVGGCYRSEGWCHSSSCSDQQPGGLPGSPSPHRSTQACPLHCARLFHSRASAGPSCSHSCLPLTQHARASHRGFLK